ncbi:Zinc-finger homeodomain protein 10 [Raphanus sativus]|uniref:Zinc-finger homeodomain protein 10 n=1 Tax=Raphanus sativus TaxID=3726 RepID=A0A6J0N196_RAPSA|nr:zinc-finger homeodomain protein 10 [Raphanus sativus]KAJ4902429.1 Zinc-finger homeodomain protein 10 [Raphanus sativus]
MDMTTHTTVTPPPKSPEPEPETPTRIQPAKPLSFSNGVIKRHHPPLLFTYKECLKNHAAALGSHALDGCGEYMPSPSLVSTDPTSLKCAACGCHRNFHRREPADNDPSIPPPPLSSVAATVEYQPHHRHHPPPPPQQLAPPRSPNSSSPPPISSSYMLLSLSGTNNNNNLAFSGPHQTGSRKRFRTKFSQFQKEKMHEFADRVGWKMQKRDEDDVREFCHQIGVDKSVLKVWMHNNKNTFNRRDIQFSAAAGATEIHKIDIGGGGVHAPVLAGETNNIGGNEQLRHSVSSGGGGFDSDSGGGGVHGGNVNGSSSS